MAAIKSTADRGKHIAEKDKEPGLKENPMHVLYVGEHKKAQNSVKQEKNSKMKSQDHGVWFKGQCHCGSPRHRAEEGKDWI